MLFVFKWSLTVGILVWAVVAVGRGYKNAQMRTLNHLLPHSYDCLTQMMENHGVCSEKDLKNYAWYYQTVIALMPVNAEAYAMLGFCYDQLHRDNEAVAAYRKAVALNGNFFWHHYNLGGVLWKKRDYQEAGKEFKRALQTDPKATVAILYSSKIYSDILRGIGQEHYDVAASLKNGYRNAYYFAALALKASATPSTPNPASKLFRVQFF